MPITQELIDQVRAYEEAGKDPSVILDSIKASPKYKDVGSQIDFYRGKSHDDGLILQSLKAAPVSRSVLGHVWETVKNVPGNLLDVVTKDLPNMVDPRTYTNMGKVAAGGIEQGLRATGLWGKGVPETPEEQMLRVGVVEPAKQWWENPVYNTLMAIEKRPVNAAINVAGGAGAIRKGAELAGMANAAAKAGAVERTASPFRWISEPVARGSAAIRNWAGGEGVGHEPAGRARGMAESAMKIPPSVDTDIRNQAINTMFDKRYPLTTEGFAQMQADKMVLNQGISDLVGRYEDVSAPVYDQLGRDLGRVSMEAGNLADRMGTGHPLPLTQPVTPADVAKVGEQLKAAEGKVAGMTSKETLMTPEMPDSTPITREGGGVRVKNESAGGMKTSNDFTVGDVREIIRTVQGIVDKAEQTMGTRNIGGVKLADVKKLQGGIQEAVDRAIASGKVVDVEKVAENAESLKEFYGRLPDGKKYIDQLTEWQDALVRDKGRILSPEQAQKMKQAIYAVNRDAYGDMASLRKEFDKSVARGLKEQLVEMIPALKGLNKEDSALINLEQFFERALNRAGNYDVVRLGDMVIAVGGEAVGAASGGAVGGMFGAISAAVAKHIIEGPEFKMRLAYALDKASRRVGRAGAVAHPERVTKNDSWWIRHTKGQMIPNMAFQGARAYNLPNEQSGGEQ